MRKVRERAAILAGVLLAWCACASALNPSLDISQYAHTAWTAREGFSLGNIYATSQTRDGYLWLGGEFGVYRFDGVRYTAWQPPAGQALPREPVSSLLGATDGTLWIGTFSGLASWSGGKLTRYPEFDGKFVTSLLEDREGTIWIGTWPGPLPGRLCAIRNGVVQCYTEDGAFGKAIWALYEDGSGSLWASSESGLWHWKPGSPRKYAAPPTRALAGAPDGRLLLGRYGAGLLQLAGDKVEPYPVRTGVHANKPLQDRELDSNKLLLDHDGGLWIATVSQGLLHLHRGRTDVYRHADGLSGDVVLSLFEDREGNIWVTTMGGLDRFRELPVTTISVREGLSSDAAGSVLAAKDGSIWIGTHEGVTRLRSGETEVFRKKDGLPDDAVQSLSQDNGGRIWVSTTGGLAYFIDGRFVAVPAAGAGEIHFMTGDKEGSLWASQNEGLLHLREGRLLERIPWSKVGGFESASVLLSSSEPGGLWLGFWRGGGVYYFRDGELRASYTAENGLGDGAVVDLRLDRDGALWAATGGGLSRIKDGRINTLTSKNGLPCDRVHWSIEGEDGWVWLYTSCGLVRTARTEVDAWIADPKHKIQTSLWDVADGVPLRAVAATPFGPRVAKSSDGKLWFLGGGGLQVFDPRHLGFNRLAPPVFIEQVVANQKIYWRNAGGGALAPVRLPAQIRDLQIDYTALSLVAPEKVHFKYMLEGQDPDWREVGNDRVVQYTNLAPKRYRFRVLACNNSGVWNEQGASLEFVIPPAWYQTRWFYGLCAATFVLMVWGLYHLRVLQLQREFNAALEGRVAERTRVARELHDTLLQSFHGLLLRFAVVQRLLPSRVEEAEKELQKAMDMAAAAITEGRDAVQGLRDSVVQGNDLARAISTVGEELVNQATNLRPTFRVTVQGESRDLHPIVRDEIYKIAAEALRNTVSHAEAKHVEVEIQYDNERFRLRVRDDGRGIDPEVIASDGRERHYGIPGMRERATVIGGKLEIWSKLDAGTELELTIPGKRAYAKSWRRSWLTFRSSEKEDESKAAGVGP
ncbi:MAG TPA: two-component regulator propeller domain-containing protein [Terriglobales bacterium]|nr:two-component regulator propeller domain-containing protein [Terriglobales bacterium]